MMIAAEPLRRLVHEILLRGGSEPREADIVSEHLVMANLCGHDSHGVGMMVPYARNLTNGRVVPNRQVELVSEHNGIMVFDGQLGYGQVVAREATERATAHAREQGMAVMALRNSHHIGRVGAYGEMVAAAGLVSVHFVNVYDHRETVAPWGGTDARVCTNPICIAVPTGEPERPFILDMATSRVAMGKTRVAYNRGEQTAPGNLLGPDGQPTTDPSVMWEEPWGALLPFGEHKGYGLALAAELMAGAITGGGSIQPGNPRSHGIKNNMLAFILDPGRVAERDWITREIDDIVGYVTASPPADPDRPVLMAGDPERASRRKRSAEGIPMDPKTWEGILAAGEQIGLPRDEAQALVS